MRWVAAIVCGAASLQTGRPPDTDLAGLKAGRSVTVRALVNDASGAPLARLTRDDFEIRVNGATRPVASASAADESLTLIVLVDVTASLHRCPNGVAGFPSTGYSGGLGTNTRTIQPTGRIPPAVPPFNLNGLRVGDRVRVGAIARQSAMTGRFSSEGQEIRRQWRALFDLPPVDWLGPSPIWDRVAEAVPLFRSEPGRGEIVIVTDGHAGGNRLGVRDVAAHAAASGVAVSVVAEEILLPGQGVGLPPEQRLPDPTLALRLLAAETGGTFVFDRAEPNAAPAVFASPTTSSQCLELQSARWLERVIDRLRHAYLVEFDPGPADGTAPALEVRVRVPGAQVVARKSFVATAR